MKLVACWGAAGHKLVSCKCIKGFTYVLTAYWIIDSQYYQIMYFSVHLKMTVETSQVPSCSCD